VGIGLDLVNIFLSKTTKKLGLFYQKLVYLSMFFVGFIFIQKVISTLPTPDLWMFTSDDTEASIRDALYKEFGVGKTIEALSKLYPSVK
jgi:hypothetical protein